MVGIKQLGSSVAQARVAQPHRQTISSSLLWEFNCHKSSTSSSSLYSGSGLWNARCNLRKTSVSCTLYLVGCNRVGRGDPICRYCR